MEDKSSVDVSVDAEGVGGGGPVGVRDSPCSEGISGWLGFSALAAAADAAASDGVAEDFLKGESKVGSRIKIC